MYAGLTTADKGALLDAIAHDGEWIVRTPDNLVWSNSVKPVRYEKSGDWNQINGRMHIIGGADTLTFIKSNDSEPVNSYTALAQIAEMESKQKELLSEKAIQKGCTFCCYTEYPDTTLYPRDKSEFFATRSRQIRVDVFDEDELDDVSFCPNCGRNLNSPYTEGETK